MGAKPKVGRPSKNTLRVELRLNADDEAVKAIVREAAARGVTLQQHITDILITRFFNQPTPQQQAEQQQETNDSASASADVWM